MTLLHKHQRLSVIWTRHIVPRIFMCAIENYISFAAAWASRSTARSTKLARQFMTRWHFISVLRFKLINSNMMFYYRYGICWLSVSLYIYADILCANLAANHQTLMIKDERVTTLVILVERPTVFPRTTTPLFNVQAKNSINFWSMNHGCMMFTVHCLAPNEVQVGVTGKSF